MYLSKTSKTVSFADHDSQPAIRALHAANSHAGHASSMSICLNENLLQSVRCILLNVHVVSSLRLQLHAESIAQRNDIDGGYFYMATWPQAQIVTVYTNTCSKTVFYRLFGLARSKIAELLYRQSIPLLALLKLLFQWRPNINCLVVVLYSYHLTTGYHL